MDTFILANTRCAEMQTMHLFIPLMSVQSTLGKRGPERNVMTTALSVIAYQRARAGPPGVVAQQV